MTKKRIKQLVTSALSRFGYELRYRAVYPSFDDPWEDVKELAGEQRVGTIFDVGANVGQTSGKAARLFPDSRIHAFEPVRATFSDLQRNTASLKNVSVYPFAFGAEKGSGTMTLQERSGWNSLVPALNRQSNGQAGCETIAVETIDDWAAGQGITEIDVLKTDTEGYDLSVLRGAREFFARGAIRFVISEVGFFRKSERHTYFPDLNDYLVEQGLGPYGLYEVSHSRSRPCIDFANALFVRCSPPG